MLRTFLTPAAISRLALGWGACLATMLLRPWLTNGLPTPILWVTLAVIVAIITICALGVVREAEHLARRLGDPYGTLVLTLSIVLIEVILISAVMLSPGEHPTIARDSIMAVAMIIMNLVIGLAILVASMRRNIARQPKLLRPNQAGVTAYLAILLVLIAIAFVLPGTIGAGGAYSPVQAVLIIVLVLAFYAFFLVRQMGAQRGDFQEIHHEKMPISATKALSGDSADSVELTRAPVHALGLRTEVIGRTVLLVATMLPIVLLSHDLAVLLDDGLGRLGAPVSLNGLLIAMIVFMPETITTVRAAAAGEMQRVSNLCHGALVSTVGLTIPAVLAIGLLTGQTVQLAESPTNLVLLGVTMLLMVVSFMGRRVSAIHGAAHLVVFAVYVLTVFQ